jgi:hypothetical protein
VDHRELGLAADAGMKSSYVHVVSVATFPNDVRTTAPSASARRRRSSPRASAPRALRTTSGASARAMKRRRRGTTSLSATVSSQISRASSLAWIRCSAALTACRASVSSRSSGFARSAASSIAGIS